MPYTFFKFKNAPPAFELGATTVFVVTCPWWPDLISQPIALGGCAPGVTAVEHMRQTAPVERLRRLVLGRLDTGLEVVTSPGKVIDAAGRVQMLQHLTSDLNDCGDGIGEDLSEFAERFHDEETTPAALDNSRNAVNTLVKRNTRLRSYVSPYSPWSKLVNEAAPFVDLGMALKGEPSKTALARLLRDRIAAADQEVKRDADLLQAQMRDCAEGLAALAAYDQNVQCGLGKAYLLLTRDLNELLELHADELVESLESIKGAPYLDVVLANVVESSGNVLHALAEKLVLQRRLSIWATLGDCVRERDAGRLQAANPKRGTFGAGTLCLYVGRAGHRGFEVPVSALVAAGRLGRDQGGASAMLEPHWGPQPSKALLGVDDLSTLSWSDKVIESLAMNSGINTIRHHDTGVRSPMFGRTPSSLQNYQFIDSNRVGALLSGNIVAWLGQVIPGTLNTRAIQSVWCDKAAETFFAPFAEVDGFRGEIRPTRSAQGTTFAVSLRLQMADQVERISVLYEQ